MIISNASDFEIFKESVCRDLFVRFGPVQQLHESPKPPIAAFREEEVVLPSVERTRSPLPVNLPSVQSASVNAPSKKYAHLFGTGTEKNSVRHGEKRASVQSILSKPMFTVGKREDFQLSLFRSYNAKKLIVSFQMAVTGFLTHCFFVF